MKSSPLLNGHTSNPSEASKRPVDLRTMGSSSTRQTISEEGSSLGVVDLSLMPDCGQGRRRRAVRLVRSGCARQARNYSIFICFELNGRANDERQPAIIRINGCFEQRLFTPGPTAIP